MKRLLIFALALLMMLSSVSALAASRDFAAIRINEFMASNGDTIEASDGQDYDWIELFNTANEDIDLEGLCLSDGKKTLDKFVFPAGITLPANGYLLIFAAGEEKVTKLEDGSTEIMTAFKLSASGEKVVISYQDVILDIVRFDQQQKDISYARKEDGTWAFSKTPTPGAANEFGE